MLQTMTVWSALPAPCSIITRHHDRDVIWCVSVLQPTASVSSWSSAPNARVRAQRNRTAQPRSTISGWVIKSLCFTLICCIDNYVFQRLRRKESAPTRSTRNVRLDVEWLTKYPKCGWLNRNFTNTRTTKSFLHIVFFKASNWWWVAVMFLYNHENWPNVIW